MVLGHYPASLDHDISDAIGAVHLTSPADGGGAQSAGAHC